MPPTWSDTNGLGASGGEDQGRSQQEEAPISPGGGVGGWRGELGTGGSSLGGGGSEAEEPLPVFLAACHQDSRGQAARPAGGGEVCWQGASGSWPQR